ncbi:RhtB (resistance to homoserine/threonine) family protein [Pseudomonas nitritireducens]|uniref:RhtB (Resistance to homoserine/threonine) family protein n=1 Tax=Pseudomonas nitroreducens TaxID=46680 RepID=A0A7W7KPM4_PSENT|nr:LysE family transporter [Pseudomonas nitritireducens]MBB4866650.1 RhtB (resistance to homoserine/threonine) family protein [Pseudomonas nitritireducens]
MTAASYFAPLLSVALLWIVAVITPGPNFFTTARIAAVHSRRHGLIAALGVASGTVIWGLAGGLGIKSLFSAAPSLYLGFKLAGGAYLIYLGIRLLKRRAPAAGGESLAEVASQRSAWSVFRLGLLGNLTNPKTALFVATLFATAMPASPSAPLLAMAIALMVTLSFSWYCCVVLVFASERMAGVYRRCRRALDRFAGCCYLLFGARMLATR